MDISRILTDAIIDELRLNQSTILIGARQTGKTYLLKKIRDHAKKEGLRTSFFDLEQPDVIAMFNKSDTEILNMLISSGDVIFIDEFHYMKNASKVFKAIYDKNVKVKIYASGSSSLEIHKHLKESLAGRKFLHKVFPCSIKEMMMSGHKNALEEQFIYGGMPGVINAESVSMKKAILSDILQSYLLKDIKSLIKEENIRAFNNLLVILAQSQGSVVSLTSLSNDINLSIKTVSSYLEILSQTFVNYPLKSFSFNYANELKKSNKYYYYDLGIRNALIRNFAGISGRKDSGVLAESIVYLELSKQIMPENDLGFWRLKDGTEVDFIWIKNREPFPIEVKLSATVNELPKGIKAFIDRYPETKKAFVTSMNAVGNRAYKNTEILYIPLSECFKIPELC